MIPEGGVGAPLTGGQVESLVVTHADLFERRLRPLLNNVTNAELDAFLARAGNVYADVPVLVPPTQEEARALLSRVHIELPEGSLEKAKLGQVMRENALIPPGLDKPSRGPVRQFLDDVMGMFR